MLWGGQLPFFLFYGAFALRERFIGHIIGHLIGTRSCLKQSVKIQLSQSTTRENIMANKALIHVKATRHPISEEIVGFRLEAATPNNEGRVMRARRGEDGETLGFYATKEATPSFRKPYLIAQSSDYPAINKSRIEKFMNNLSWQGYKEFELVGKYEGEPLQEILR